MGNGFVGSRMRQDRSADPVTFQNGTDISVAAKSVCSDSAQLLPNINHYRFVAGITKDRFSQSR